MSPTHFWFGALALKSCASRFAATGRVWFESVVALNFFAAFARSPWRLRLSATVLRS
jgi:hypothetical protein